MLNSMICKVPLREMTMSFSAQPSDTVPSAQQTLPFNIIRRSFL